MVSFVKRIEVNTQHSESKYLTCNFIWCVQQRKEHSVKTACHIKNVFNHLDQICPKTHDASCLK